jgi:Flp pilus assembly protein TadG
MTALVKLGQALRRLSADRTGQIALIFGLMLVPMLFASGAAIDYSRRNAAKVRLDAALDAAVLAVMSQKSNTIDAATLTNMERQFRAEAAKIPGVTLTSFAPNPLTTVTSLTLSATYAAKVSTTLGRLMNVSALAISGTASGTRNMSQYIDFYLLLDNSPSMGLAATDTDVSNMKALTGGCAFACHEYKFDSKGNIKGDDETDFYHVAKKNNIKLRIQVLRDAVMNLVDTAKETMSLAQQFRMEVWTFSDIQTKISALTTNLDRTKSDASQIDLAYSLYNEPDNQTSYERAITKMNSVVPTSGNGVTAASPIRFLFFVTDGVQDTPIDGAVSDPSIGYKITNNRFIGPINPTTCQAMKDKGIRIGIIYTTYLPIYDNSFYNANVKPFETKIPTRLKACATDGLFFQVSTGGDINAAMQTLFQTAVASVRLTN